MEESPHPENHNVSDTLVSWKEASRPFKKRDSAFFQTTGALAFLIVAILFFIREWLIIGTALAVVFVSYVLAAVPPSTIWYKITEKGIWVDDIFYRFSELTEYWFEKHLENMVLVIMMPTRKVGRLTLVVPFEKKEKIDEVLRKRLVFREKPLKSMVDSLSDWVSKKVPLEEK
jgi:hypothetical protein